MGGRRSRQSGVKSYRIRVKEPDRDETLLEFDSKEEIEARSGDWLVASYDATGKLRFLTNSTSTDTGTFDKARAALCLLRSPYSPF